MSKEAVFLAWGHPARKSEGEDSDNRFERWIYTSARPVHHQSIDFYHDRRLARYSNHYPSPYRSRYAYGYGHGHGYGHDITWIQQETASVDFRGGRVTRWQRGRSD
jgi:hypothetical protein